MKFKFNKPFKEQLKFFRSKGIELSPESWRQIWADANARAFTVAGVSKMDMLLDIKSVLDEAIAKGVTLEEFKSGLNKRLASKGWLAEKAGLQPWRVTTIFRTNLQSSYQVGRYVQMQEVSESRPYWQYQAVMDASTRDDHAAMDNKVFRSDDPVWDSWYPPNGFNCRCYITTLNDRQLKSRGLRVNKKPPKGKAPDEGFDYNVGKAGLNSWKPDLSNYPAIAKKMIKAELKKGNVRL